MVSEQTKEDKLLGSARVHYQCRRGMLELDVFLMPFCDAKYSSMEMSEKKHFVQFLDESDPDMFAWLMAYIESPKKYQNLIDEIRVFTQG